LSNHPEKNAIREKINKSCKETLIKMTQEERKQKYGRSGEKNGMYGKIHTDEVRKKFQKLIKVDNRIIKEKNYQIKQNKRFLKQQNLKLEKKMLFMEKTILKNQYKKLKKKIKVDFLQIQQKFQLTEIFIYQ